MADEATREQLTRDRDRADAKLADAIASSSQLSALLESANGRVASLEEQVAELDAALAALPPGG